MKNPFRSLFPILRPLPAVVFLSLTGQTALLAQTNGTWTLDGSGNWSNPANWSGGSVASGGGAIADFSTLDINGEHLVTIDAPFTIGTLLAQDATTASNNWTFGGAGPLTLDNGGNQPVIDVINQSLAISAPLDGANGFSKTGSGTLNLSGASTYSGTTTLAAGTLKISGGNDRLPIGSTLAFTGTTGALDLTTSQTMAGLTVPNGLAASYTVSGTGLTIDGAADRQFGPGGTTANPVTPAHSITMNLSGLSSFTSTAPANIFRVGLKSGAQNSGNLSNVATVTLADQNAITAASLRIGDIAANNNGGISTLQLGGVTTLNVGFINTGASGRSNANLLFDPNRINPSVTIRNTDGTSAINNWDVGRVANFNAGSNTWTANVDLSSGVLDAKVTTLRVGIINTTNQLNRYGTQNSNFKMGNGILEVTNLVIGEQSGSYTNNTAGGVYAANGTFTLNHESGLISVNSLRLAESTGTLTGGTRRISGTFNLENGTVAAGEIRLGDQTATDPAAATRAFNFSGGTITHLAGQDLAITDLPLNLTGTGTRVFNVTAGQSITTTTTTPVSGPGGITKTGPGTLSLQGANTYTGPTDVQAGTLAISNSFPNGSAFTVNAAATLELANVTVIGPPTLDIDGNLNLTGPVAVGGPLTSVPGTLTGVLQYGSITGAANLKHNYRNASFTVGATATDLNVAAGSLLTWTGAGGSSWDLNTTASWKDASNNPQTFFWADSVVFDAAGSGTPDVNLTAEMQPMAITVNEAAVDYVFSGSGFIGGTTGLAKSGAAKLTIATNNTNTGTTTIQAGTLEVGSGGTTGSLGSGPVVNNASLVFNRSNPVTFSNPISGTGSVTKLGASEVNILADNSYTGGTTISAGSLFVGRQTPTGSLGTGDVVNDGQLRLNRADGTNNPYAYTFANNISGSGSVVVGQNLAGSSAFDSVVTLTGNNTFTGGLNISSGGVKILNVAALGIGPKVITLTNGSNGRPQFYLDGSGGNITVPADFSFDTSVDDINRPAIGNIAGDNVIEGNITLRSGGGNTVVKVIGGTLALNGQIAAGTTLRNLRLAGTDGANGTINGLLTNGTNPWGLFVLGPNTWTLTNNANDYTGNTTVSGGTLALGADNVLPDATAVTLGAGTLDAATFDDTAGTLDCSGPATINVGAGGTLAFLDSSAVDWTGGTLQITGTFVPGNGVDPGVGVNPGSLRFGTTNGGLTSSQLASISAPGWTGFALDDYGYLTATAALGYASWAALNGAGANLNDDHDNDGVDNGVEYFIGGPNGNTTGFTPLPGVTNTGGVLSITWTKAGDYAGTYGNHFVVETSDSLGGTWSTEASPGNVTISGNNVTYTFPSPLGTKRFARLKVTGP
jgi:autotransporter-associated beta strand protein